MKEIKTIIFDLGGVLIDWNPEYVYLEEFNGDRKQMQWFFDTICTFDWNENQDAGYPLQKATEERVALFPEHETLIRMYYGRWEEMLGGPISDTVEILNALVKRQEDLFALTNWSHETFPIALQRFEFLHWFKDIVVSGEEQTRKPHRKIYEIADQRFKLQPEQTLFIDDNLRNVNAAIDHGWHAVQFTSATTLIEQLSQFNIAL